MELELADASLGRIRSSLCSSDVLFHQREEALHAVFVSSHRRDGVVDEESGSSTCVGPISTPHRLFPLAKLLGSARNGALLEQEEHNFSGCTRAGCVQV